MIEPLRHDPMASDDRCAQEASKFLASHTHLRFLILLKMTLRALALPWWSAVTLLNKFPVGVRMGWFADRPDIRQQITTKITGLMPLIARKLSPAQQTDLIMAALQEGGATHDDIEAAFGVEDLVVYGDAPAFWALFCEQMQWSATDDKHKKFAAGLIRDLMSLAILTALQVLKGIDRAVYLAKLPVEIHVAIAEERIKLEELDPTRPFLAADELEIATPEVLTEYIPLEEFLPLFGEAKKALGFEPEEVAEVGSEEPARISDDGTPTPLLPPRDVDALEGRASKPDDGDGEVKVSDVDLLEDLSDEDQQAIDRLDGTGGQHSDLDQPFENPEAKPLTREQQLRAQGLHVPELDMSELEPPPGGSNGTTEVESLRRNLEEARFMLTTEVAERLGTSNLRLLLALFTERAWPESEPDRRDLMSAFLIAQDPVKHTPERLDRLKIENLHAQFCGAVLHINRELSSVVRKSFFSSSASGAKLPPPLPTTG